MMRFSACLSLAGLLALAGAARGQAVTFAPTVPYAANSVAAPNTGTGGSPSNLAVADINGDGRPDVLLANAVYGNVGVVLNGGNGTLRPVVSYSTGVGSFPSSLAVADVNHDGKPDVLVADFVFNTTGVVGVLLGNGDGTLQPITRYAPVVSAAINITPYDIAVGDLNGDGHPDLIIGSYTGSTLEGAVGVLLGTGTGTFRPMAAYAGSNNIAVAVADVNGDKYLDVLTANITGSTVGVRLGNGDGTLRAETTYSAGAGSTPYDVAVADVNGDGRPDLLTANYGTDNVGVLLNTGSTFQAVTTYPVGKTPAGLAAADVNGDGQPDLLTANYFGNSVSVLLNTGSRGFQPAAAYSTNYGAVDQTTPLAVAVADINGDGRPDLLTANWNDNSVGVFFNTIPLATRAALPGTSASLAPNPAGAATTLSVAGLPTAVTRVQATVLDAVGREVSHHALAAARGTVCAELPTTGLAPGLYIVRLTACDGRGEVAGMLAAQRLTVR